MVIVMTELEKIAYARMYIEKLANGVNPLTDQAVPDTDLINNVRISRCLFYVSDIMRQVEEQGGIPKKKTMAKKLPFQLSYEDRLKFHFSEMPIPISEITRRINDLIDAEQMTKLSYKHISDWLIELGALTVTTGADGKLTRHPTPRGMELGITTEQRHGQNGMYTVVIYDRAAQQLIVDNLDAAIELSRRPKGREAAEMQGKPWAAAHDEILAVLFRKQVPVKEIAITLKRTEGSVRSRLDKLGLIEQRGGAE